MRASSWAAVDRAAAAGQAARRRRAEAARCRWGAGVHRRGSVHRGGGPFVLHDDRLDVTRALELVAVVARHDPTDAALVDRIRGEARADLCCTVNQPDWAWAGLC